LTKPDDNQYEGLDETQMTMLNDNQMTTPKNNPDDKKLDVNQDDNTR
jgi:hypothetical protein